MSEYAVKLFAGRIFPLPPDGTPSGICKRPLKAVARLTFDGLEGDHHAERQIHGGKDKALHHFPAEHYAKLAERACEQAQLFLPGSIGENISSTGLDETEVRIGDVFSLGECRVQVSGPRTPCWKIDHRYHTSGLARFVHAKRISGWYYRVLVEGIVDPETRLQLVERNQIAPTIHDFWKVVARHRPRSTALESIAATPGLAPDWKRKLNQRARWLKDAAVFGG